MKTIRNLLSGAVLFVSLNLLHAQTTNTDSIVQITAEAEGLSQVPLESVPIMGGTFWVVSPNGVIPPFPGLPVNLFNSPIYDMGDGTSFLVDATAGQVSGSADALGNSVANLIEQTQTTQMLRDTAMMLGMDVPFPGDGGDSGGGDYTNYYSSTFSIDTNGLWLEITNVSNGWSYLNLHNGTNVVYAIWGTTNLLMGWQVATEVWPTNGTTVPTVTPFVIQNLNRQELFLRAQDWTGVDSDSDGVPDWWAWKYFGTVNLADTNLDYSGNGHTFAYDYSNNITPTVFSFTGIQVASNIVNSITAPMQLDVTGHPYYVAALVDDTNFVADANWQFYTGSSVTVSLGLTEGWHDVWIGLLGHGSASTNAVWQWQRMKLDYTAPPLVITGPTNSMVTVPLVQITGYSPEALASISYDISNAVETVTNQQTMITGQAYSTNTFEFITNYFQCYDVPLANGLNTIKIHATDLAGNATTLTTNITYSATTNSPIVALVWPQNGMQISGDSITIQGRANDPTAKIVVATVDADGNTNSFSGLTGRDGVFWIENVPLSSGTNQLAVTVSNGAGETTANVTLIQSSIGLTVNSVQAGDATVTGAIDTSGYTIWVNGNQATNGGSGTWTAPITPIGVGGGQVAVTAIPNSDNGGNGSGGGGSSNPSSSQGVNAQATVQPPQGVFISSYHKNYQNPYSFDAGAFWTIFGDVFWDYDNLNWEDGSGGTEDVFYTDGYEITFPVHDNKVWPANSWPQSSPDGTWINLYWDYDQYDETTTIVTNQSETGGPSLAQEHCDMTGIEPFSNDSVRRTADTEMKLATGGPLGSKQMNLWCLTASATAYTNLYDTAGTNVPYDQIEIGGYGNLNTNGELWVMLPDNDPDVVTPHVKGKNKYSFSVGGTKYTLKHTTYHAAFADTNLSRTTVGVGEEVSFGFQPTMPYAMDWTTTAGSVSPTFSSGTTLTSPSNAASGLTVTATLRGGKSVQFPPFTVVEPAGIDHAKIDGTNSYPLGAAGAGMHNVVWIAPTSVSFYRVNVMEIGLDATNIGGYFADTNYFTTNPAVQLHHATADHWTHLNSENEFGDSAYFPEGGYSPWAAGGYEWNIPQKWQVVGSGVTNSMAGCNQVFSIDSSGTAKVAKYGNWIQRTTNNVINAN